MDEIQLLDENEQPVASQAGAGPVIALRGDHFYDERLLRALVIADDGSFEGSVSGGCVEGEVIRAAKEVIRNGRQQILEFGVTDDEAWQVGLACGGQIQILVEPVE